VLVAQSSSRNLKRGQVMLRESGTRQAHMRVVYALVVVSSRSLRWNSSGVFLRLHMHHLSHLHRHTHAQPSVKLCYVARQQSWQERLLGHRSDRVSRVRGSAEAKERRIGLVLEYVGRVGSRCRRGCRPCCRLCLGRHMTYRTVRTCMYAIDFF
jgi:hypothetical protein